MFTGIIEELGVVIGLKESKNLAILSVKALKILKDLKLGESIAVNGVCLTVTKVKNRILSFDLMKETLVKSSLGDLRIGSNVNLERALKANSRFNGHIVTGHIDLKAKVLNLIKKENYVELKISLDKILKKYIVPKGSICLDGVSLTVSSVRPNHFSVHLIPFTRKVTTLGNKKVGDSVNIEADLLAKYILNKSN